MMENGVATIAIIGVTCCRTTCRRSLADRVKLRRTGERRSSNHSAINASPARTIPQSAILLGAHMSIGGGVHTAIERGCSIKCTAIQIFVKNNMQWFARPLAREEIRAFLEHRQRG